MLNCRGTTIHRVPLRLSHVLATLLLSAVLVAGCSDSSEPPPPPPPGGTGFRTTIAPPAMSSPVYDAFPDGVAIISCDVTLRSTGQGAPGATWREAVLRWYPARDLRTPFDSAVISKGDVALSWGGTDIKDGVTQVAAWRFLATIPFTLTLDYHYRIAGAAADSSASAQFTCQPPLPVNPALPTISVVTILPSGPTIEPGDSLDVSFRATAPAGLWQTIVSVSGACDTAVFLPGFLTQSTPYTVRVPLGPECVLGASLIVSVLTVDAALQTAATPPVLFTVVDQSPPSIDIFRADGARIVWGDYFAGDTIDLGMSVADNHQLRWVAWEAQPSGVRDSVQVAGPFGPSTLRLPVRASWGTSPHLAFTATDVSGNVGTAYPVDDDSLHVYPDAPRPTAWRAVAGDTRTARVDSKRGVFYLLLGNERQLVTFGLTDAIPIRTLNLPEYVTGIDFTVSGDSLLMACPLASSLAVLDLTLPDPLLTLLPLSTPDTTRGQLPYTILGAANGKAFVGMGGPTLAEYQLIEIDLATGTEALRLDAGNAGVVDNLIARSAGHDFLVTGSGIGTVQVYDASTDRFGPLTQLPPYGGGVGVSADGQVITNGLQILSPSLQLVRTVHSTFGGGVPASFLAPDGQSLYYFESRGLIRTRVSDGAVVERSRLPFGVAEIRVSDDGQWAVYYGSAGMSTGQVGVIDLR